MEQWNNEAMSVDIDVEEIREANRYRNISLNKIPYLAFIAKYAPYSAKEMCHLDGSTEVLVEWENILSSQKVKSLPDAVNVITASYAHAAKQSIEEFDVFKTTSKRRIKRFLDTLLDQKDCVKRFFQDGFSQLQTNDLIYVLRYWESGGFQSFCGNNYEKVNEIAPNFSVDIEGYVYDFVVGCLDDQINPQELSDLWHQKLKIPYETKKKRLKEQVDSELDNVKELISTCIDPRPQVEDMEAQLKFLSRCLRLIGMLEEKIIKRSSYMKKIMAEENDKFWIEIYQQIKEKDK